MSEHSEQKSLITWCDLNRKNYPGLEWIFAIPNGGKRNIITAKKLKAEGVKPGVFDLFLPVPRGIYHGLFIEMKFGKKNLTEKQEEFRHFVFAQGFYYCVCWTWIAATDGIIYYLRLK
jgi:hypothetical protein